MKKIFILSLFISFFLSSSFAQTVPVSGHLTDQVVLGPCYVFSTIAALESKAMQGGGSAVNFNEWQNYSTCVIGALTGSGDLMIPAIGNHFGSHGGYSGPHDSPTRADCPNPEDYFVPCIADFNCSSNSTWCRDKMYEQTPSGYCLDNESNKFEFDISFGDKYCLQGAIENIDVRNMSVAQKKSEVTTLLSQGNGVIANFSDWTDPDGCEKDGPHSVFIYKHIETIFSYKDSWPCNPSFSSDTLPWGVLSDLYYISGNVSYCGSVPLCNSSIYGPNRVGGSTNYILSGNTSNINWSVSGNLSIVGSSTSSTVTVIPNTCSNAAGTISVTYNGNCTKSKTVNVRGKSPRPHTINVLSSNWNSSGQTCPNTILELNAVVFGNFSNLNYQWSISGATLLSGQGTSTVFVRTPNYNSNLVFKVRTKRANCPFSPWRTIYGNSSSSNPGCNGGGGGTIAPVGNSNELDFFTFFDANEGLEEVSVEIYNTSGALLKQSQIFRSNPTNEELGISQSFKQFIAND